MFGSRWIQLDVSGSIHCLPPSQTPTPTAGPYPPSHIQWGAIMRGGGFCPCPGPCPPYPHLAWAAGWQRGVRPG